jgi:hypothetical protein
MIKFRIERNTKKEESEVKVVDVNYELFNKINGIYEIVLNNDKIPSELRELYEDQLYVAELDVKEGIDAAARLTVAEIEQQLKEYA